ncbi:unnamed protein product [Ranitomeya imitator]|uniref:Uncharacterized protein n=1 Tax=Ranitomeya imitator TaxID=111125 RepID=A0ABN9KQ64_9NEOB|nr:unnamed protein product [Ranitomeya imitator]
MFHKSLLKEFVPLAVPSSSPPPSILDGGGLEYDVQCVADSHMVIHYMKNSRVNMSNGRVLFFDKNGDPPPIYHIINWQIDLGGSMKQVKVGNYINTATYNRGDLIINTTSIRWPFGNDKVLKSNRLPRE